MANEWREMKDLLADGERNQTASVFKKFSLSQYETLLLQSVTAYKERERKCDINKDRNEMKSTERREKCFWMAKIFFQNFSRINPRDNVHWKHGRNY